MDRELLSDSRGQLEAVCRHATAALFITDEGRRCVYMNPAAERLTGCAFLESGKPPLHSLFRTTRPDGSPYPCAECPIESSLLLPDRKQGDVSLVHQSGHLRQVAFTTSPIHREGRVIGTVVELRDVTAEKQAAKALARIAAQRELALKAAKLGWWHYDPATQLSTWDERYAEIFGVDEFALPNSEILLRLHPDDLPQVWAAVEAALDPADPQPYLAQYRIIRRDGQERWIEAHGQASFAGEGDLRRATDLAGTVEDVTERRGAQEALRAAHDTFRHLVENSPFGLYAVDADFRLVQVSAGAQKVFSTVRPLLGRDFAEVLRILWPEPFASEAIGHFREVLATGVPYHSPRTVERRNDIDEVESYDWKVERVTLPDGRLGVVCHFYDLSERLAYEQALRHADRRKDEFLAMLAHELRNPLGPILNAVEVLRADPSPERLSWGLPMIQEQVQRLSRMLDDLLDVSRITHGKVSLRTETLAVADIVRTAIELAQPFVDERGHSLVCEISGPGLVIEGDRDRLTQVLLNLIHNAAKYTQRDGTIHLLLTSEEAHAVLRVRDTGRGIAPELLPHVFELFTQGDQSPHRTEGGLGIGLSLVKQLVELHGGSVEAHSRGDGQGSELVVRLPARVGSTLEVPRISESFEGPKRSLTVLVVEDNASAAESLVELLELWGHRPIAAPDGIEALRAASAARPEVIILDIGLPGLDGYQVAVRLRAVFELRNTLLIALTGYGQQEDRERSAAAGIDMHLVKPVDPRQLQQLLNRL